MNKTLIIILLFSLSIIYLFPITKGLILLPLDLLVSSYTPWSLGGQILLKNPYMQDSIIQLFPWKYLVYESLRNGLIPFWNPFQLMGLPFMAGMKPGIFYPLNIFTIFSLPQFWNLLLFSQIFLALTFSYLLARDFKLSFFASLLTSFAFSLNTLMIGLLEFGSDGHALIWVPLAVFCAKRFIDRKDGIYLLLLSLTLATSIFAGQLQYTGYILILLSAFIIFYGYTQRTKQSTYILLFIGLILGVGISLIQLIPSLELFSYSIRNSSTLKLFSEDLMQVRELARLFAPDLFGNPNTKDLTISYIETGGYFGVVPLFFAFYAIFLFFKNKFVRFFTVIFFFSALLSLDKIGPILYLLKIPLITSGSGSRIFSLAFFSGSFLSGFGLDYFIKDKNRKNKIKALIIFSITFLLSMLFIFPTVRNFTHNVWFAIMIFSVFTFISFLYVIFGERKKFILIFLFFITFLTFLDLFRIGYRFLTFSNTKFLYPETPVTKFIKNYQKNTLSRSVGLAEPEIPTLMGIYSIETYNPLYPLRTARLLNALQRKNINDIPGNKYMLDLKRSDLKYALDFLGVSLIVGNKLTDNPSIQFFGVNTFNSNLKNIFADDKQTVYENTDSYPRFNLFYNYETAKDKETLKLISGRSFDFKNKIILEEKLPIKLNMGQGSIKLLKNGLNDQTFSIQSDKTALFYISDTYFPGWKANLNGKKVKIYKANYNFRAVIVPAGKSILSFSYEPSHFELAKILSVLSLLGLSIITLWTNKNYRKN